MSILDLWLPITVTTLVCFFMSSAIWVVFKWHNSDYRKTDREDAVSTALEGAKPGFYLLPYCVDYADMAKPEVKQRFSDGPVAFITVAPNGIAVIPESIWFNRPWPMTVKNLLDALIYGLLTGGIFGWLV